jgi:hypothetical protein
LHRRDHRDRHDLVYELHYDHRDVMGDHRDVMGDHRDVMGVKMKKDDC